MTPADLFNAPAIDERTDAAIADHAREPHELPWVAPPLDKNGIPILVGDVLKVFHFIGARRKRHYMYKQVVGLRRFTPNGTPYLIVSHLNMKPDHDPDGAYHLAQDGKKLTDTEILQGLDDPEQRRVAWEGEK